MKYYGRFILFLIVLMVPLVSSAQEQSGAVDSLRQQNDSLVMVLRSQVQELQMQRIMMQEQLEKNGEAVRNDSLRLARRRARIDSLRSILPGAPLIVEGDTLFILYNRRGGITPESRVEDLREKIIDIGTSLTFFTDSIYIFEGEFTTDIMAGDALLMSVTDNDGMWQNQTRQELAAEYRTIIEAKIQELHAEYGMKRKLIGVLYVVGSMLPIVVGATGCCASCCAARVRWLSRTMRC